MRFFVVVFLGAVMVFLVSQIFALNSQKTNYEEQFSQASAEAAVLEAENEALRKDLEFYQDDENLAKELRAQFNYRQADEELLILVPAKEQE